MKDLISSVVFLALSLQLYAQSASNSGLGMSHFVSRRAAVASHLSTGQAAVIFSGELKASGFDSPVPSPFSAHPDFFYLTGLNLPNSVLVIFPGSLPLKEGPTSQLLFVPDDKQLPLNVMGYTYDDAFGRVNESLVTRSIGQWRKFCLEILDADMTERIFALPTDPGDFSIYRQNYQFQPPVQVFFNILAPYFQAEPEVIQHYNTILRSDTSRLIQDQRAIRAWLDYHGQQPDPLLRQFLKVKEIGELKALKTEIREIKFDFEQLREWLRQLRLNKSSAEIEALKESSNICALALLQGAKAIATGKSEMQVEGEIYADLLENEARPARSLQVIAGPGADRYLYSRGDRRLAPGEVVVLDVAAEKAHYVGHIARTFPVDGQFPALDRTLYIAAVDAHKSTMKGCRPETGPTTWCASQRESLMKSLDDNVLSSGSRRSWRDEYVFISVFPIGLNLFEFDNPTKMKPGMVFAVETLISIPDTRKFKSEYRGRAIRLRDVVLIRGEGPVVLTREAPLDVEAVEALINAGE